MVPTDDSDPGPKSTSFDDDPKLLTCEIAQPRPMRDGLSKGLRDQGGHKCPRSETGSELNLGGLSPSGFSSDPVSDQRADLSHTQRDLDVLLRTWSAMEVDLKLIRHDVLRRLEIDVHSGPCP